MAFQRPSWITKNGQRIFVGGKGETLIYPSVASNARAKANKARASSREKAVKKNRSMLDLSLGPKYPKDHPNYVSPKEVKQLEKGRPLAVHDFVEKTKGTDFSDNPAVVYTKRSNGEDEPVTIKSVTKEEGVGLILNSSQKGKMSYSEVADAIREKQGPWPILLRGGDGVLHSLKDVNVDYDEDDPDGGNLFVMEFERSKGGDAMPKGYAPKRVR